ncbi:MAG: hypothetical protein COW58_10960 [Thalassolituus sp. CG17_big_fil_post_rev_8_21_14_2_50_53_8]|nr:MAG: hypothetical protein COW58_10960 [Thalassolituus sp. CG17_big_fil_post_rev_8_21_14_2_50_53_8]
MTAPTIYKSSDPGAPAISSFNNAVYEVLRACLIDGYPGKTAAGWSAVYDEWSATGIATFKNAADSGILGIVKESSTSYGTSLFIADAMVDATHAVNARSGRVVVSDLPNLPSHGAQTRMLRAGMHQHWCVIGNEYFFIVFFASSDSVLYQNSSSFGWTDGNVLAAGSLKSLRGQGGISDAALGNFWLIGGYPGNNQSSTTLERDRFTPLYDETGAPFGSNVSGYIHPLSTVNFSYGYQVSEPLVNISFRQLEIFTVASSSLIQGELRQVALMPMLLHNEWLDGSYARTIYGPMFAPDLLTTSFALNGKNCVMAPLATSDRIVISLDAADWQ